MAVNFGIKGRSGFMGALEVSLFISRRRLHGDLSPLAAKSATG